MHKIESQRDSIKRWFFYFKVRKHNPVLCVGAHGFQNSIVAHCCPIKDYTYFLVASIKLPTI